MDWGSYYAAKTMIDAHGRRILWGWIPEIRPDADLIAAGWAGAMSLPRVLSLNSDNELQTEVEPAVRKLRADNIGVDNAELSPVSQRVIEAVRIKDLAAEIDLRLHPKTDDFTLRLQSDIGDFASISCSKQSGARQLRVNTATAPLPGLAGSSVRLHMFLDGSVLEVFANETITLTARVYQVPSGPLRLKFEGDAKLMSLDAWRMQPISKDRLTGSLCS